MHRTAIAIAIIANAGRVLICQRRDDSFLGGLWEFPGGKVEPGETPLQCAVREAAEEAGLVVRADRELPPIDWDYPEASIRIHPFVCRLVSGEARALASQQVVWARPDDLRQYRFPPANDGLVRLLPGIVNPA